MSKKARICKALLLLLGFGGATASKCDGPVDMYGPAVMYGPENMVMYGPAPTDYVKQAPSSEGVSDVQTPQDDNNSEENK